MKRLLALAALLGALAACAPQPMHGIHCAPNARPFCEAGQCICISR